MTSVDPAAERLRDLANYVDQATAQLAKVGEDGEQRTYAQAVANIQHEVLWVVANLHLDQLTTLAQESDEARAKASAPPEREPS